LSHAHQICQEESHRHKKKIIKSLPHPSSSPAELVISLFGSVAVQPAANPLARRTTRCYVYFIKSRGSINTRLNSTEREARIEANNVVVGGINKEGMQALRIM